VFPGKLLRTRGRVVFWSIRSHVHSLLPTLNTKLEIAAMESLGTGPSSALDSTFGALLVGLLFATFLQGLLTVQTYNYYEGFREDPLRIKLIVGLVWSLDTVHLGLIAQSAYSYLITNWGYQPALARSTRELCVQLLFIGLSTFVCQLFFLHRIWIFSKKNIFIVGSILAICVTTLGLTIVINTEILEIPFLFEFGAKKGEIIALFMLGAAADILIAYFLCYYLRENQSSLESRTKSLIGKILRYTIATGLATSALGIASVIAYFAAPQGFYFIAIHFCLGRLYTNALLITLNARHKLRTSLHTTRTSSGVKGTGVQFMRFTSPFQSDDRTVPIDRMEVMEHDNAHDKSEDTTIDGMKA